MGTYTPPVPFAQPCDVVASHGEGQTLIAHKQFGAAVGGGAVGNSSFLIPHSSFTTRQSKALAWGQAK